MSDRKPIVVSSRAVLATLAGASSARYAFTLDSGSRLFRWVPDSTATETGQLTTIESTGGGSPGAWLAVREDVRGDDITASGTIQIGDGFWRKITGSTAVTVTLGTTNAETGDWIVITNASTAVATIANGGVSGGTLATLQPGGSAVLYAYFVDDDWVAWWATSGDSGLLGSSETWDMPLVLTGIRRYTYSGPQVSSLVIPLASSGHADGAAATLYIPANSLTSSSGLILAPDLNVDGDTFDATLGYVLVVERVGGRCISSARTIATPDTTAPTLLTATIAYGNADGLVLNFSEPVYIDSITGLSLAFSVGTARTITAIESGNGTATVTLTLSGNVGDSDVLTFSASANTIQDLNGNVASTITNAAVTNNSSEVSFADTWIMLRGDNLGADGSSISQWTDQSANANHFTQGTAGERPTVLVDATINSQKCVNFDGTDDSLINVTLAVGGNTPTDITDYSVILVWKHDGTTSDIPFSFSDATGLEFKHADLVRDAGVLNFYGGVNSSNPAGAADSSTSWRYAIATHATALRELYINGALFASNAVSVNPNGVRYGRLGRGVETGAYPFDGKIAELRFVAHVLTAQERTDVATYMATRYGL